MNKTELAEYLKKENIPNKYYSLNGGLDEGTFCLEEVHGRWQVYSVERGAMWSEHVFDKEEDVCKFFLDEIIFLNELIKKKLNE